MSVSPREWHDLIEPGGVLAAAVVVALALHWMLYAAAARFARRTGSPVDDSLVRRTRVPTRVVFPLLAALLVLPALSLRPALLDSVRHLLALGLIVVLAWGVIALTEIASDLLSVRYRIDVPDNLEARRIRTQLQLLRRVTVVVVSVVALSAMLMSFPSVRHLGVSLFASAGIAGLVAGLAARPTLSNLIAGIQIALTQPIRIEDVVIVEKASGAGSRRSAPPTSWSGSGTCGGWWCRSPTSSSSRSRTGPGVTADLLGTVYRLRRLYRPGRGGPPGAAAHPRSRRASGTARPWGLQVTDATESTVQLRALMSAPDSSAAWDLRCHVREKLIAFLQREYPGSLPVTRAELGPGGERAPKGGDGRPEDGSRHG